MAEISKIFTESMMGLLEFLRSATGSYGWAIVLLATLIKIALFYPTQSQYKSMKSMQKIQPLLKKLQEKFKSDPQKLQVEQMELFKKHKVNPLGGCLPIIIQMPILIGIFMTIRKMAALGKFTGQTFLWIGGPLSKIYPFIGESLAHKDIPLLLIYGVSMFLSQKATATDASQEKTQKMMTMMMPVLFTFILFRFPSSLILYWLIFNVWSIVQQSMVMRSSDSAAPATVLTAPTEAPKLLEAPVNTEEEIEEDNVESEKIRSRSRKKKGGK